MAAIIIIDDQSFSLQVLSAIVGSMNNGYTVKAFPSAQEALDWAANNPIALVITDYRMPGMDGIEFIRSFRSYPACTHVPVIMVSAENAPDVRATAIEAGATDFLAKPVNHQECRDRCRALLEGMP